MTERNTKRRPLDGAPTSAYPTTVPPLAQPAKAPPSWWIKAECGTSNTPDERRWHFDCLNDAPGEYGTVWCRGDTVQGGARAAIQP
jgi:hypothetical protein